MTEKKGKKREKDAEQPRSAPLSKTKSFWTVPVDGSLYISLMAMFSFNLDYNVPISPVSRSS